MCYMSDSKIIEGQFGSSNKNITNCKVRQLLCVANIYISVIGYCMVLIITETIAAYPVISFIDNYLLI